MNSSVSSNDFDAIVVGSGISGGWAAKELTERGLTVLLVERGRDVRHRQDYITEGLAPWELEHRGQIPQDTLASDYPIQRHSYALTDFTDHFFVNDREHPYSNPGDAEFHWIRGYQLGGRSLLWHRQSYRWGPNDFLANSADGHGADWPIRYEDIAPWYDYVERFAGISGSHEDLEQLPDGVFQPPFEMNCAEKYVKGRLEPKYPGRKVIIGRTAHLTAPTREQLELGRARCMSRNECQRGCSFGAYFSTLSATLPAAERTGKLHKATDTICERVTYESQLGKASGIQTIHATSGERKKFTADLIFLCASTLGSTQILLNSACDVFPGGLGNSSGALGRFLMDHVGGGGARGLVPGFEASYDRGRRPTGIYIPRYSNLGESREDYLRGFGFQGSAYRKTVYRSDGGPGVGAEFKERVSSPGPWVFSIQGFGEMLPYAENKVSLEPKKKDKWGIPLLRIECRHKANERRMIKAMSEDAEQMLRTAGLSNVETWSSADPPGQLVHEMGTARMGKDPSSSVLNGFNQAHEVPNLFVTDGAAMASSACQNPSLTYMALTARACDFAAQKLRDGLL